MSSEEKASPCCSETQLFLGVCKCPAGAEVKCSFAFHFTLSLFNSLWSLDMLHCQLEHALFSKLAITNTTFCSPSTFVDHVTLSFTWSHHQHAAGFGALGENGLCFFLCKILCSVLNIGPTAKLEVAEAATKERVAFFLLLTLRTLSLCTFSFCF